MNRVGEKLLFSLFLQSCLSHCMRVSYLILNESEYLRYQVYPNHPFFTRWSIPAIVYAIGFLHQFTCGFLVPDVFFIYPGGNAYGRCATQRKSGSWRNCSFGWHVFCKWYARCIFTDVGNWIGIDRINDRRYSFFMEKMENCLLPYLARNSGVPVLSLDLFWKRIFQPRTKQLGVGLALYLVYSGNHRLGNPGKVILLLPGWMQWLFYSNNRDFHIYILW